MKIIADPIIPFVKEAFETFGEVHCIPGRSLAQKDLHDVDILVIRSTTPINAALLDNTAVRFIANCSAGEDHIDRNYLAKRGIEFSSAKGSNANSVAEYVVSALLSLGKSFYQKTTLGVIGVGNIGSLVVKKAEALGMRTLQYDPPLQRKTGYRHFVDLQTLLAESDIVTCHVPISTTGSDPTHHLLNHNNLIFMKSHGILINSSRGAVVDNRALLETLEKKKISGAILDVFEGEPDIDLLLLHSLTLATPHIAGHSIDGKVNGTQMAYESVGKFIGNSTPWDPQKIGYIRPKTMIDITSDMDTYDALVHAVHSVYDIREDDCRFRVTWPHDDSLRQTLFDQLRINYPIHSEFETATVSLLSDSIETKKILRKLGFSLSTP